MMTKQIKILYVAFLLAAVAVIASPQQETTASREEEEEQSQQNGDAPHSYGIDCSWPIHNLAFRRTQRCDGYLPEDRVGLYYDFMKACRAQFGERCEDTEFDRIAQARRQPQSMVNYTSTGYKKTKAPEHIYQLIREHWERNKDKTPQQEEIFIEKWTKGHTYVNYWHRNTTYYGLQDLRAGGSQELHDEIFAGARDILEEWTGMELREATLYGIRVYKEGAILAPHVDRSPLVSSAIINVAQDPDMEEDWPLEVYGRDGQAVNISMVPGDMVLYESGSLLHARPFSLKGKFYANVFIHFEPTGRKLEDVGNDDMVYDTHNNPGNYEDDVLIPPYLVPGSPEASRFAELIPLGWEKPGGHLYSSDEEEYESGDEDHSDDGYDDDYDTEHQSGEDYSNDIYSSEEDVESDDEETDYMKSDEEEEDSEDSEELEEYAADETEFSRSSEPSCPSTLDPASAPSICRDKTPLHKQVLSQFNQLRKKFSSAIES